MAAELETIAVRSVKGMVEAEEVWQNRHATGRRSSVCMRACVRVCVCVCVCV